MKLWFDPPFVSTIWGAACGAVASNRMDFVMHARPAYYVERVEFREGIFRAGFLGS